MNPKISVVVAAYNEEKLLPRFLESLQKQTYPHDAFEIIIVNNGSTDRTEQVAKKFHVRVYPYTEIQGCSASRAYGADHAKGSILAFTDADSVAPSDWLSKIDTAFQGDSVVCIGGRAAPDKQNIFTIVVFGFYHLFISLNILFAKPILWGFNMAVKKDAYATVGGFNKKLLANEDWDLAFRLKKKFGKDRVLYKGSLVVKTSTRKQNNPLIFIHYVINGAINYYNFVIRGKNKPVPIFNVR